MKAKWKDKPLDQIQPSKRQRDIAMLQQQVRVLEEEVKKQTAMKQQAEHLPLGVQLGEPVFIPTVGALAFDIEVAVKTSVQKCRAADGGDRFERHITRKGDIGMLEMRELVSGAPRLDQRIAVVKPGVMQKALVGQRVDLGSVMTGVCEGGADHRRIGIDDFVTVKTEGRAVPRHRLNACGIAHRRWRG